MSHFSQKSHIISGSFAKNDLQLRATLYDDMFYILSNYFILCHILHVHTCDERWGAGVETQKNVRGEIGGWGRVPFNETYAPSLSTIYDGA